MFNFDSKSGNKDFGALLTLATANYQMSSSHGRFRSIKYLVSLHGLNYKLF